MSSTAFSRPPLHSSSTGPLYGSTHVPDFPVQAFARNEPALRRRPVAVLDGVFPLLTVVAANAQARRLGVRTGMTRLQLDQFSGLEIRQRSAKQEEDAHQALLDCVHYFTPRIEETAADTLTLDLNGLSGLWGTPRALAQKLLRTASHLGLEVHVATAPNPDAAIHAARSESGITIIHPGEEARKLAPLPLTALDLPDSIQETLGRWGLRTFGELGALPAVQVSERLGPEGVRFRNLARGAVERPLEPARERLHFSESMELETPIESLEPLTFILSRLLNQLCRRLTARNLATQRVSLTLTLDSRTGDTFERQLQMPIPTREAKTLLKLLQLDLDAHRPPAPVAGVTLTASPATPRRIQTDLFRPHTPDPEKLELTLARIGAIIGEVGEGGEGGRGPVGTPVGTPVLIDSHRPDAFRIRRFRVPSHAASSGPSGPASLRKPSATPAALRLSRPPQPITVDTEKGAPARILFAGQTGVVVRSAGPWSSSGDWWRADAWNREEWDVEVRTGWRRTLYRIYRDPRKDCWYLDATYD